MSFNILKACYKSANASLDAALKCTCSTPIHLRFGGWVVDGFPRTRENWAAMIEQDLLPDFVLSLVEEGSPADCLLNRFTDLHGLPNSASLKAAQEQGSKEEEEEAEGGEKVHTYTNSCCTHTCSQSSHWPSQVKAISLCQEPNAAPVISRLSLVSHGHLPAFIQQAAEHGEEA